MSGFLRACHIMIFCGGVCVEHICFSSDKKWVKLCISGWSGLITYNTVTCYDLNYTFDNILMSLLTSSFTYMCLLAFLKFKV